ncbi:MAG: hypothetical protein E7020_06880 [Alphaproteobacteria bacterium]|nr:hypothetical protein [Alphaproteobacteria bacterium]
MIHLTKEQKKKGSHNAAAMLAGLPKFHIYSDPRGITIKEETYGIRKVINGNKVSQLEAVDAIDKDGNVGWVVNLANRQRKFVSEKDGYKVIPKMK